MMSDLQVAIIAVLIVISAILFFIFVGIFLTKYQYFEMDFTRGILLKRIKLLRIDIDWKVGKVYEFPEEYGEIKVISEREIYIRSGLNKPGDYFSWNRWNFKRNKPLLLGRILVSLSEPWLEIRMSYASLIGGIYISSFIGFILGGIISEFIPMNLFAFCLGIAVYFLFLKHLIINDTIKICKKFCVGLR